MRWRLLFGLSSVDVVRSLGTVDKRLELLSQRVVLFFQVFDELFILGSGFLKREGLLVVLALFVCHWALMLFKLYIC
jgi:hypothetical protein